MHHNCRENAGSIRSQFFVLVTNRNVKFNLRAFVATEDGSKNGVHKDILKIFIKLERKHAHLQCPFAQARQCIEIFHHAWPPHVDIFLLEWRIP